MDTEQLLLQIAVILVTARLGAELAVRLKAPPMIGEICAGLLIGPSLLGWIAPHEVIKLLAEIGIILLLFEVGVETDISKLITAGPKAVVVAITGFILPFLGGFALSYWLFDLPLLVALFIGGTFTATSIGITVRILAELNRHTSYEGQIILGAAVVDDILGVFLLAVLYQFAKTGNVDAGETLAIFLYVGGFFVIAPILAKLMLPLFKRGFELSRVPGVIPVAIVAFVLLFAGLSQWVGAPEILGGFAAGLALSRRFFLPFGAALNLGADFTHTLQHQMRPIIQLFTPFFFVTVGLSVDLSTVDWGSSFFWWFSLTMLFIAIVSKIAGAWLIRESIYTRTAIGMAMVPRGEVGLIFAELARSAGVFDNDIYAAVTIVVAYTTLLAPFWIKSYYRLFGARLPPADERDRPP